jgi:hypothetical protein
MSSSLTEQIAHLRTEMAHLDQAIQALRDMPASQAPLREQMSLRQVELAALLARTTPDTSESSGPPNDDPVAAARYEQFLATLLAGADQERAGQQGGQADSQTGLNLDPLRLAAARGLLAWRPVTAADPAGQSAAMLAAALAAFVTTPLMALTPGSRRGLSELASFELTSLILEQRLARRNRPSDSLNQLRRALSGEQYRAGCRRLLSDLGDVRGGLPLLGAAYLEAGRPPAPALRVLAAGTPFAITEAGLS